MAANATAPAESAPVFVSYASADAAVANSIVETLELTGLRCWIAPRDVKAGAQYADAIVAAINDANGVVLVLSGSAVASSHVSREVERAASKHKRIIGFRIDAAPLSRSLEYFLGESQWINVPELGMPAALAKLKDAVGQESSSGSGANRTTAPKPAKGPDRRAKLVAVAVLVIGLGTAAAVGVHFWSSHKTAQPASVAISDKSIAVLPFTDMSEKHDQEYFGDGMAEEILDLLAKVPGVRVIGRTSSFQFKGKNEDLRTIGNTLGAAYVLEGSVRKSGERLRVTAQLIATQNGSHLWSETYDDDIGDVLKVQDRIASGLVRALQVTVGADYVQSQPTLKSAEAYDLYLRGRHAFDRFDKAGTEAAVGYFQQALELDPSFIRAAEWFALTLEQLPEMGFVPPSEGYERARTTVQQALVSNPRSGTLHAVMAEIHAIYDWDWPAAQEEARRALALDPRSGTVLVNVSEVYLGLGQWDEAARLLTASLAVDPLMPGTHELLATVRERTGRVSEAEKEDRNVLAISPTYEAGHFNLGEKLMEEGRLDESLAEVKQDPIYRDLGLAFVYHAMGREAESAAALAEYTKERADEDAFQIAEAHAFRGEVDQAFAWLDRAFSQKDPTLYMIKGDLHFKNIEPDPRYKALLRKMNLPE
jgi:TolB-like protein